MEKKALHILFTWHPKKRLQSVPFDFKHIVIGGILDLNGLVREHFNYHKRTSPRRPKLPRKRMKSRVIQEHFFRRREVFSIDLTIMKNFSSLLTQTTFSYASLLIFSSSLKLNFLSSLAACKSQLRVWIAHQA